MCTEPGSEKTVTQVENLIVVEDIPEHDGQTTERQKKPDGVGIAVLPGLTGENHALYFEHACILPVEMFLTFVCATAVRFDLSTFVNCHAQSLEGEFVLVVFVGSFVV